MVDIPLFCSLGGMGVFSGPLLEKYYKWKVSHTTLLGESEKIVVIHDLSRVARPQPGIRRTAATLRQSTRSQTDQRVLMLVAIVTHPVIRGALCAIDWMTGGGNAVVESTQGDAIRVATRCLMHHGLASPHHLDPNTYSIPPVWMTEQPQRIVV